MTVKHFGPKTVLQIQKKNNNDSTKRSTSTGIFFI